MSRSFLNVVNFWGRKTFAKRQLCWKNDLDNDTNFSFQTFRFFLETLKKVQYTNMVLVIFLTLNSESKSLSFEVIRRRRSQMTLLKL